MYIVVKLCSKNEKNTFYERGKNITKQRIDATMYRVILHMLIPFLDRVIKKKESTQTLCNFVVNVEMSTFYLISPLALVLVIFPIIRLKLLIPTNQSSLKRQKSKKVTFDMNVSVNLFNYYKKFSLVLIALILFICWFWNVW